MKEVTEQNSEFAGHGGSFEIRGGKRVRVEETKGLDHPDVVKAREAERPTKDARSDAEIHAAHELFAAPAKKPWEVEAEPAGAAADPKPAPKKKD